MKERIMQKDFIEKLKAVKNELGMRFPQQDMQNIHKMMSKLAHYHYNKRKFFIIGEEKKIYDFLIENSYNPYTVYKWMLLERIPDDLKFQLRQRQMSQKKAFAETFKRKHETDSVLAVSIKEMGLSLIRRM